MKTTFLFQGQGGFHSKVMQDLFFRPELTDYAQLADEVVLEMTSTRFSSWMSRGSLAENHTLEQIGIFLEGFFSAQLMLQRGVHPDVVIGHSFGEYCALAIAGAISLEDGIRLICARLQALDGLEDAGGMAAVSADHVQVGALLASLSSHGLEISVLNHRNQTVVSGPKADIDRLVRIASQLSIGVAVLSSRYPFHSKRLEAARSRFAELARSIRFRTTQFDLYLPDERIVYYDRLDMPELLSSHLVRRFDFMTAVNDLFDQGVREFVECGGSTMLRNIVRRILGERESLVVMSGAVDDSQEESPSTSSASIPGNVTSTTRTNKEVVSMEPIAIIGFGSVLPGATDSDKYWQAIQSGISGIYNYDVVDPHFLSDCYSDGPIRTNKTYSRLCGTVTDEALEQARIRAGVEFPSGYAKIQKMLSLALHEALCNAQLNRDSHVINGTRCFFGATSDGISEYDDALVLSHLEQGVLESAPPARRQGLSASLHKVFGKAMAEQFSPSTIYERVIADVLCRDVSTMLVDAACSSSLYAIDLAAKSLASGECSLAICGGAFAAGIGNNCMFAQFGGLARTAIRPLDEQAEGTVFCDGAVVLLLRRLRDAVRDGNPIHGVIRGIGLSSDGKAPAVNVPTSAGQQLAIERAYENSGIDKQTIQYVEMHATGTSGDSVEFNSLKQVFTDRLTQLPRIRMGSNKALIGHTGWASGASAVVKLLLAFKHATIPAQHSLGKVNQKFEIDSSPFEIPRTNLRWTSNIEGYPRRAAVNGFGFGGTNAHLIIEESSVAYHDALIASAQQSLPLVNYVLVGTSAFFPGEAGPSATISSKRSFNDGDFTLPPGKLLLPDIREHMARAQFLMVMAADPLVKDAITKGVEPSRIGVVLVFNDKCERACAANLLIYKDRILRMIREAQDESELEKIVLNWYRDFEEEHLPIGPYTLAGIMPNVITGRVANLYNLKGPNFVVGDSRGNALSAVKVAQDLIRYGDADLVLCGGLHLGNSPLQAEVRAQEGIVLFALTTDRFAHENDLPIVAELSVTEQIADPIHYCQAA